MLAEAKREMLTVFMKLKKRFIEDATKIDNEKGTQLVQRLNELIPDQYCEQTVKSATCYENC